MSEIIMALLGLVALGSMIYLAYSFLEKDYKRQKERDEKVSQFENAILTFVTRRFKDFDK